MEVDFGVLAMWVYSTRYRKFREASPLEDYVAQFTAVVGPPGKLKHIFNMENGTSERDYVRCIGQEILRGKDIKHMMRRAWSLYGIPKYIAGELDVDIFNDPDRLAGADKSVEYVLDLFYSIRLSGIQTVVYPNTFGGDTYEVSITKDSIATKMDSWGYIKTTSTGFEYELAKPENHVASLEPVADLVDVLGLTRTHLFIASWIAHLQGLKPNIMSQFDKVREFLHVKDLLQTCDVVEWETQNG